MKILLILNISMGRLGPIFSPKLKNHHRSCAFISLFRNKKFMLNFYAPWESLLLLCFWNTKTHVDFYFSFSLGNFTLSINLSFLNSVPTIYWWEKVDQIMANGQILAKLYLISKRIWTSCRSFLKVSFIERSNYTLCKFSTYFGWGGDGL